MAVVCSFAKRFFVTGRDTTKNTNHKNYKNRLATGKTFQLLPELESNLLFFCYLSKRPKNPGGMERKVSFFGLHIKNYPLTEIHQRLYIYVYLADSHRHFTSFTYLVWMRFFLFICRIYGLKFIVCKLNWNQEHPAEPSRNVKVKFACYCFSA